MACKTQVLLVANPLATDSTVRNLLSVHTDWEVRGVITNGKEVIAKILELIPHVVVLDMSGPAVLDPGCIREIRRIAPDIKLLVVSLDQPTVPFTRRAPPTP
jgi:DNA-binding NarL/FixJ family response regulator